MVSLSSQRLNQKEKQIWQSLAQSEGLTFVSSENDETDAFVIGEYQGHYLSFRTIKRGSDDVYHTYISLRNQRTVSNQVSQKVLNDLLKLKQAKDLKGSVEAEANGNRVYYEQHGVETDVKYLKRIFNYLVDLTDIYPQIIKLGSESLAVLQEIAKTNNVLRQVSIRLIQDIAKDTTQRLSTDILNLWCLECVVGCSRRKVKVSGWNTLVYYGCRTCGQSQEFFTFKKGQIVAMLNNRVTTERFQQGEILRVNWLIHHKLFDFDKVEIVQATDEEVERFAVQVGNDTDKTRKPRYQQMDCVVSTACELSENTLRILQRMFGQVEIKALAHFNRLIQ